MKKQSALMLIGLCVSVQALADPRLTATCYKVINNNVMKEYPLAELNANQAQLFGKNIVSKYRIEARATTVYTYDVTKSAEAKTTDDAPIATVAAATETPAAPVVVAPTTPATPVVVAPTTPAAPVTVAPAPGATNPAAPEAPVAVTKKQKEVKLPLAEARPVPAYRFSLGTGPRHSLDVATLTLGSSAYLTIKPLNGLRDRLSKRTHIVQCKVSVSE